MPGNLHYFFMWLSYLLKYATISIRFTIVIYFLILKCTHVVNVICSLKNYHKYAMSRCYFLSGFRNCKLFRSKIIPDSSLSLTKSNYKCLKVVCVIKRLLYVVDWRFARWQCTMLNVKTFYFWELYVIKHSEYPFCLHHL